MNLKLAHPGIKDLIIYSRTKACSKLVRGLFSLIAWRAVKAGMKTV